MPPLIPDAAPLDGTETVLIRQGGKLARLLASLLKGAKGDTGTKGDTGSKGDKGDAGTPKRVERYTASITGAAGQAAIVFSPAFAAAPEVFPVNTIIAGQLYLGVPSAITAAGATLTFYRTKGTLLLTASAVELAPAGTSVSATAIGN